VRALPLTDPGTPDARSATAYLRWLMRVQARTLLGGIAFGIVWMTSQAVLPAVIGRGIDAGVTARDTSALVQWCAVLLAIGAVQVVSGIMRHRFAVTNWLAAAYTTVQVVTRQVVRLGGSLPRQVSTGEVVAIGTSDISHLGHAMDVTARASGAVVSIVVVAALLLDVSVPLGLVVLLGVPLLLLLLGPLLAPLQRRTAVQRELTGGLANLATDIVGGLRVLLGIGGEQTYDRRYVAQSQAVRTAGVSGGRVQSVLDALQVLLPGTLVVVVVWIGARFAVDGRITPGELVAFYGYAAFLVLPVRTLTEFANKWIKGIVSARRVVRVLRLEPDAGPAGGRAASDVPLTPGVLTAVVAEPAEDGAALLESVARQLPGGPDRVLLADATAGLFSGELRAQLDVHGRGDDALLRAVRVASAEDVLDALPDGLDTVITERGRTFSGGQRQRLVLTRALTVDPDVLLLAEPTSAVDAHTEGRIAERLATHRAGRTTVVTTSSPLVLDRADEVVVLRDGLLHARGRHADLLAGDPAYRAMVTREEVTA